MTAKVRRATEISSLVYRKGPNTRNRFILSYPEIAP